MNYTDTFLKALAFTLSWEGGYVNNPYDKGGPTNKGITQQTYDDYCKGKAIFNKPVKDISDNEVKEIYWFNYWLLAKCYQLDPKLATVIFDTAVNSGVNRALKFLKNTDNPFKYIELREAFLKRIAQGTQQRFLKGWLSRCKALKNTL